MRTCEEINSNGFNQDHFVNRDEVIIELYDTVKNLVKVIAMTADPQDYENALRHPTLEKYRGLVEALGMENKK